jgi:hypothetical protein
MLWLSARGVRQPTLGARGRNSGGDANERRVEVCLWPLTEMATIGLGVR